MYQTELNIHDIYFVHYRFVVSLGDTYITPYLLIFLLNMWRKNQGPDSHTTTFKRKFSRSI